MTYRCLVKIWYVKSVAINIKTDEFRWSPRIFYNVFMPMVNTLVFARCARSVRSVGNISPTFGGAVCQCAPFSLSSDDFPPSAYTTTCPPPFCSLCLSYDRNLKRSHYAVVPMGRWVGILFVANQFLWPKNSSNFYRLPHNIYLLLQQTS